MKEVIQIELNFRINMLKRSRNRLKKEDTVLRRCQILLEQLDRLVSSRAIAVWLMKNYQEILNYIPITHENKFNACAMEYFKLVSKLTGPLVVDGSSMSIASIMAILPRNEMLVTQISENGYELRFRKDS